MALNGAEQIGECDNMTDKDVIDNAERSAYGIPEIPMDLDKQDFLTSCMDVYKSEEYKNEDFAEYFSEDFLTFWKVI